MKKLRVGLTDYKKIIQYLRDFGKICCHKAKEIGVNTPSARLSELEKKGIITQAFNKETCEYSSKKHSIYVLAKEPKNEPKENKTIKKEVIIDFIKNKGEVCIHSLNNEEQSPLKSKGHKYISTIVYKLFLKGILKRKLGKCKYYNESHYIYYLKEGKEEINSDLKKLVGVVSEKHLKKNLHKIEVFVDGEKKFSLEIEL